VSLLFARVGGINLLGMVARFAENAGKYWDKFYKQNSNHFFKDRHWIHREWPVLMEASESPRVVAELGCGTGSTIFPLLKSNPLLRFYAVDFAKSALQLIEDHPNYDENLITIVQADLTRDALDSSIPPASVDIVTLIFVLSAMTPQQMDYAITNVFTILKPGGLVLFRDYVAEDVVCRDRFSQINRLDDRLFVRTDGTQSYFFQKSELEALFHRHNFQTLQLHHKDKEVVNRSTKQAFDRTWLQGTFVKHVDS